jgi:putative ABC transport system permease protein
MEIANILASLRRNKLGAVLVMLQIALAMAIVSNAVFVVALRNQQIRQPTGLDEQNIFTMANQMVTSGDPQTSTRLVEQDLEVVRSTPNVIDAYATESLPLMGGYDTEPIGTKLYSAIDSDPEVRLATAFRVDDHALQALGLKLVAGRWFRPTELVKTASRPDALPEIIVTQALADQLFPRGDALGAIVYQTAALGNMFYQLPGIDPATQRSTIIGIVETLRIPGAVQAGATGPYSYLIPWRRMAPGIYVVRVRPGQLNSTMRETQRRLRAANPLRVISSVEPFTQTRWEAFRLPRSTVIILVTVCTLLLAITAFGIVGLTSYWVAQRRHHIGMRRALGARRGHILAYYQTENLLIAGLGATIGIALTAAINLWLMRTFAVQRLDWPYVMAGAISVLALGQVSAFWPAFRAASIPPALAARAR